MAWEQPTDLARSFVRHLRAENKSPGTIDNYLEAVKQLTVFLAAEDRTVTQARREDLEAFFASLLERWTAGTAVNRYRALRVFYSWLVEEDEIRRNPMARMKPPAAPERPVPVLSDDELRRLLATCAGTSFPCRRDTAIVMLMIDSGARRAEIVGLRLEDAGQRSSPRRLVPGSLCRRPRAGPASRPHSYEQIITIKQRGVAGS
jgi:integrase/recombinase XerC